jgi:hypothetical protein
MRAWTINGAFLLMLAPAALAGPEITIEEKSFDAGPVERGTRIEHVFQYRNTGDQVLKIMSVRPSCGCTVAREYDREILPGGEGALPISLDTTKFRGSISKTITVSSNAENLGRMVLQVKASVIMPLEVLPNERVYVNARAGQEVVRSLLLRPQREGLEVTGVSSDNDLLTVALESIEIVEPEGLDKLAARLQPREGDLWLRIKLSDAAPVGVTQATVRLATSDPEVPKVDVFVRANVRESRRAARSKAP